MEILQIGDFIKSNSADGADCTCFTGFNGSKDHACKEPMLDLSNYHCEPLPAEEVLGFDQWAIVSSNGKRHGSCYVAAAHAVADVVYSRLSKRLGIPCLQSEYGFNLPACTKAGESVSRMSSYVSVTFTKDVALSEPYSEWVAFASDEEKEAIKRDVDGHRVLGVLVGQSYWDVLGAGVVTGGRFYKANNGAALRAFSLQIGLESDTHEPLYGPITISVLFRYTRDCAAGRYVLKPLAALTDHEIADICRSPFDDAGAPWDRIGRHMIGFLESARLSAQRFSEAIDDELKTVVVK